MNSYPHKKAGLRKQFVGGADNTAIKKQLVAQQLSRHHSERKPRQTARDQAAMQRNQSHRQT